MPFTKFYKITLHMQISKLINAFTQILILPSIYANTILIRNFIRSNPIMENRCVIYMYSWSISIKMVEKTWKCWYIVIVHFIIQNLTLIRFFFHAIIIFAVWIFCTVFFKFQFNNSCLMINLVLWFICYTSRWRSWGINDTNR